MISIDLTGGVRKTPSIAEEEEVEEPVRSETPREESPPPVKPGHAGQYIYRVLDITIFPNNMFKIYKRTNQSQVFVSTSLFNNNV